MDPQTLSLLVRRKLRDGRLPHDGIRRVWSGPSDGYKCDACDTVLAKIFLFSSRRRHTSSTRDWSSEVCSSDLRVVSDEGSAKPLGQAGAEVEVIHDGDELEIGAVGVHIVGRDHAVIHPDIPVVPNVGYLGGVVMLSSLTSPLTPFVDALPLPARRLA